MPGKNTEQPVLLILNQSASPLTWELAEDLGARLGPVALLTGQQDALDHGSTERIRVHGAARYVRRSFPRRALSWLQYTIQAFFWLWRWPSRVPLLVYSNPPILVWLAWLMRLLRGQHYAVMVYDIYPEVLTRLAGFSESHSLVRIWRRLNRAAYSRSDLVMTIGECMAAVLAKQFDPSKTTAGTIEVIYPWADTAQIKPLPKESNWFARQYEQVGKLTVMYSGNMGLEHDIEGMVAAARELREDAGIHFLFVGGGPKWRYVQKVIETEHPSNVTLLAWQPEETLPYSLATAEVALVSLQPGLEGLSVPSKSIRALAAGSALMVLAGTNNELAAWVERFGCGHVIGGQDGTLAAALAGLLQDPEKLSHLRANARAAAESIFSRQVNTNRTAEALRRHLRLGDVV